MSESGSQPPDDRSPGNDELSRLDPDAAARDRDVRVDAGGATARDRDARADTGGTAARDRDVRADTGGAAPRHRDGRADAGGAPASPRPELVIDTRRYQRIIGLIGLAVVIALSVYLFTTGGAGTTGVGPGHRLRWFAAPLATTDLRGAANLHPPCAASEHDPRALNLCIDARRGPVVLSLFVLGGSCERQVDALQALSRRFASVQFLAVALNAGAAATAKAVRDHRWTIPVAYDEDGRVGEQYGVVACPMVELARRGGIVADRLIGDRWDSAAALAPRVQGLIAGAAGSR